MKNTLFFFILSVSFTLNAQKVNPLDTKNAITTVSGCAVPTPGDLVLNGNFEQFSELPSTISQITRACGWFSPTLGTPDYFHRDGAAIVSIPDNLVGNREVNPTEGGDAYAGVAYSGGAREMIRSQLNEPLEPNTEYTLKFDVAATEWGFGGFLKFQAYLGGFIETTVGGELPIATDPDGILLENDEFTTNTTGWDTITLTFTTGNIANQEYLYIGAIFNVEVSGGLGYSYIDNISLKPPTICGICTDGNNEFPQVSASYTNSNRIFGKTVATDCYGNVYSLGYWDGNIKLNKFDLNGNLIFSESISLGDSTLFRNAIMEVDQNEFIYIKHNTGLYKYNVDGTLSWEITINNSTFGHNIDNFTLNKENGDIYLPINNNTIMSNITTGIDTNFTLPIGQSDILKIDTSGNIINLGAFTSSRILNLHFNDGLKSWSRNTTGIEYRKYIADVLVSTDVTWLNNFLISNFENLSPLFYNHANDEVYLYSGSLSSSNNTNTRILSIDNSGIIKANILLPEALYIGQHLRNNATYAFNYNSGKLAVYADNYSNNGSSLISTISSDYELDTKSIISSSFLISNPFYSRSFHAIAYGGDCLYFYGQYNSATNINLDGGIVLPLTGGSNSLRSVIIRLQENLVIKSQITSTKSLADVVPNPIENNTVHLKFTEPFKDKITYMLQDMSGNLILQKSDYIDSNQAYDLIINKKVSGLLFLKIIREDGTFELKKIIVD